MQASSDSRTGTAAGFKVVQIQTQSRCNGRCAMCPYGEASATQPQGVMSEALFARVVDGLAAYRAVHSVCLMLQNEPLLDPRLSDRVRYARERLPNVDLTVVTNGQLLTRRRVDELAAAGLSVIQFSLNALTRETFARVAAGLDFDAVWANLWALADDPPADVHVIVRMCVMRENEAEITSAEAVLDVITPLRQRGFGVTMLPVMDRAGSLDMRAHGALRRDLDASLRRSRCPYLFDHLNVLFDGTVVACCQDWRRESVLGSLATQTIAEAWSSPEAERRRRAALAGAYGDVTPCATCDLADTFATTLEGSPADSPESVG
jgi:MoaA/NifB/PqqE/SkfB family radical SAM enzyme